MKPTVGRVVWYTSLGDRDGRFPPEVQAALITKVARRTDTAPGVLEENFFHVSMRVFYEDGDFSMKSVPFTVADAGTEAARGKWCWPARES